MAKKDYSKLSKDELLEVIKNLESKKKYGLVWDEEKVPEKVVIDCQHQLPVLKEVKDKEIITDPNQPTHILIEGDNYHALSVLNYTHKGKIDLIYIDPPYNTGNKDFVYNDCYVEKEDTWRHSKWLNFMSKRLKLAKELLSYRGTIFISIDENEFAQLKLLSDSIFGEENYVIDIIWNSRKSVSNDTIISLNHNHTLFYAKNISYLQAHKTKYRLIANQEKFTNPDNDPRGNWVADPFDAPNLRPNLTYPITNPNTGDIYMPPKGRCWRTTKEEYERFLREGRIIFGKMGRSKPQLKRYFSEAEKRGTVPKSIWDDIGTTTNGTQELEKLLGQKLFNNPKPVSLISRILEIASFKDSIILDFFAGSGTTGQAVMDFNKIDNGSRKFILVTNNENNNGHGKILDDVCYPRIFKILNNNNLKYFKTSFVKNRPNKDQLKIEITKQCTEMLCLKEGIFNLKTITKDYKIFEQNNAIENRYMAVFYDFANASLEELKKEMNALKGEKILYCFTLLEKLETINFKGWKDIRLEPIPQKILDIYLEIFKK
jgi:adenine-specific DNA-methyltransferase